MRDKLNKVSGLGEQKSFRFPQGSSLPDAFDHALLIANLARHRSGEPQLLQNTAIVLAIEEWVARVEGHAPVGSKKWVVVLDKSFKLELQSGHHIQLFEELADVINSGGGPDEIAALRCVLEVCQKSLHSRSNAGPSGIGVAETVTTAEKAIGEANQRGERLKRRLGGGRGSGKSVDILGKAPAGKRAG